MSKILIIGTGSWATALGSVLLQNKHQVYFYGIDDKEISSLKTGQNPKYFKNYKLPSNPKQVSKNLINLINEKPDFVLIAVPSIALEEVSNQLALNLKNKPIIINASKAFDFDTKQSADIKINSILKNKIQGFVKIVGPSFAIDVINKDITFVNIVSQQKDCAKKVSSLFDNDYFVCTYEPEETTVQFASTFKNVLAIACGLTWQLTKSSNTRAAIFSQGIKEISRILKYKSLKRTTLFNYSGIGDIFLTCTDTKSRNFQFGQMIGKYGINKTIEMNTQTVEGYHALKVIKTIIEELKLEKCPVIYALYDVIYNNKDPSLFLKTVVERTKSQQLKFWNIKDK